MKNNEIMVSAKFESNTIHDEISFLVLKDITLKALIEAIYYGLKKSNKFEEHFALLEYYLKTRKEVQVLYNAKGDFNVIDFTEKYKTEDGNEQSIFNKKLDELGFATSSCLLFTTNTIINPQPLFKKSEKSYILSTTRYGSSYSDVRQKMFRNPDGTYRYDAYPFFEQYKDNASSYVSLSPLPGSGWGVFVYSSTEEKLIL